MNRIIPLMLALAAGCSSTSVGGDVDGTRAGRAKSAVFDRVSYSAFGFSVEATVLLLSDIPDACEMVNDVVDVRESDCVDACTDWVAIADDHLGRDDYWWTVAILNPYDDDVGTYAINDDLDSEGDANAGFAALDFSELYDQDTCVDECNAGNDIVGFDDEQADAGSVVVDAYENNAEMKGSFELSFPGDDTLTGQYKAEHCQLEDFIAGLIF